MNILSNFLISVSAPLFLFLCLYPLLKLYSRCKTLFFHHSKLETQAAGYPTLKVPWVINLSRVIQTYEENPWFSSGKIDAFVINSHSWASRSCKYDPLSFYSRFVVFPFIPMWCISSITWLGFIYWYFKTIRIEFNTYYLLISFGLAINEWFIFTMFCYFCRFYSFIKAFCTYCFNNKFYFYNLLYYSTYTS